MQPLPTPPARLKRNCCRLLAVCVLALVAVVCVLHSSSLRGGLFAAFVGTPLAQGAPNARGKSGSPPLARSAPPQHRLADTPEPVLARAPTPTEQSERPRHPLSALVVPSVFLVLLARVGRASADSGPGALGTPLQEESSRAGRIGMQEAAAAAGSFRALVSHMHSPWGERIDWYLGSEKAGTEKIERPYSRRELAVDFGIHVVGFLLSCVGFLAIGVRIYASRPPAMMALTAVLYAVSLIAMWLCSFAFNVGQAHWYDRRRHLRAADHAGICLLIAGSYGPPMAAACSPVVLAFVWIVGAVSVAIKTMRSRLDRPPVHVLAFLSMGYACTTVWPRVVATFSPWGVAMIKVGGALYTLGLIPWALLKKFEWNICIWHVFVLLASGCIFSLVYSDLLGASAFALKCIAT